MFDKYFWLRETYYISGKIKSRLIASELGFYVGKKYSYDEFGNLIDIMDFDMGYPFNYQAVMKFYEKKWKKLDFQNQREGIRKVHYPGNDKPAWYLAHKNRKTSFLDIYLLDGGSGQILKKYVDSTQLQY